MEFVLVMWIMRMNLSEWFYLLIGSFVFVINGLFLFVFVLVLLEVLVVSKL